MSQVDNTQEAGTLARRGRDGLAQLGPTRFDVAHIRFIDGEDGASQAEGQDADASDGQDSDGAANDGHASGDGNDDGFDGEFDAKRARTLITRLRDERNKARDEAKAAKDNPEAPKLQGENLRLRIALRVGLDEDLADRLRGSTEDELLEDAQKLVDRLSPSEKKLEDRTPKPRLRGGSAPEKEPEMSPEEIVKQALGR